MESYELRERKSVSKAATKEPEISSVDDYNNAPVRERVGSRSSITGEVISNVDGLHRMLQNRQIQLIAIGGSIGTAIFVTIGGALHRAGAASLLLAYILYSCVIGAINNGTAEMTIYQPVSGGFTRLAGHWVDEAFGFMAAWNFFLYEGIIIPFEIVALTGVLGFWSDNIPPAAVCAGCMVCYALLNVLAVRAYGESEFWLSGGKVFLILIVFSFTFITMCGGNPKHDAYGFRNFGHRSFAEYVTTGSLGKFEGWLNALWNASFTVVGPEYISMVAAEAKHPRVYIKEAFKTVYWRFAIFFIGSALCVGVVLASDDPTLTAILSGESGGSGTASASPYVIAMKNLGVDGLPHVVNALLCTSIFSAGNTYTYCATRALYGLALEGRAPKVLQKTTKNGVPIYAFCVVLIFPALSFLQVSSGSQVVLNWLVNLATAAGVITYIVMSTTFICYYRATQAQNFDRSKLPYRGYFQPYCAWFGLIFEILVVTCYGYTSFSPFSYSDFLTYYMMVFIAPLLYFGWKFTKKTKFRKPHEVDLIWEAPDITAYEEVLSTYDPVTGFWSELFYPVRFLLGKTKKEEDRRSSVRADLRK